MDVQQATNKVNDVTDKAADAVRHAADSTLKGAEKAVDATKAAAKTQFDKASDAVSALQEEVDPTINDLAAKAQALAERSINYCADRGERLRQQVDEYSQATNQYVIDQPAKSMLMAFGSGAAFATLLILATRGRRD